MYNIRKTKTGKNLFDETQLLQATGWKFNSDGYYTGTISNLYSKFNSNNNGFNFSVEFKENTQYTISCIAYTNSGTGNGRFVINYTDGTVQDAGNWNYVNPTSLVTTTQANKTVEMISYTYGSNATAYVKNIQIEEGNATTYEPYENPNITIQDGTETSLVGCNIDGNSYQEGTPTPDSLQEVEVVESPNYFDNTATPIFTSASTNEAITNGVKVKDTATGTYHSIVYKIFDVSNYVGKKFTIKSNWVSSSTNTGRLGIGLCDENGGNRILGTYSDTSGTAITYTIPTITTSKYLAIWLYSNTSGTTTSGNYINYTNIMLNEGEKVLPYVPYNNIGVNVVGKNLINYSMINTATLQEDGYYYIEFPSSKQILNGTFKENTQYTLSFWSYRTAISSGNGGGFNLVYTDGTSTNIRTDTTNPAFKTITSTAGKTISYVYITWGSTNQTYIKDLILNEGTSTLSYVPYTNTTTPIDLQGNFIGKIGSIKDELNIDDLGNVILTKRIGKVVLNGSENWIVNGQTTNLGTYRIEKNDKKYGYTNLISDYFITLDSTTISSILGRSNSNLIVISIDKTIVSYDVNAFKTWLNTHNTTVYYELETPYTVNLGKANIELNEGVNYITFLTGLDTRNTIEYGSDTSEFREQSYSGESLYKADLRIYHNEEENIIDMEQIARITIKDPIIDTTSSVFYLGSFIAKSITIKFKNLDGIDITSGDKVTLQIAQTINNEDIYIPIGEFYVDDLAENYQTTCEIVCNDASVKFKQAVDYSSCFGDEDTATIDTILQEICDICEVPLGKYPTINGNLVVGVYDGSISGKQWISYIAELKGCNAKIDRYGRLSLIPLKQSSKVSINALESKNWNLGEKYTISQVRYYNGSLWYESPVDPENDENVLYIRNDNPFIDSNELLDNIYDLVADCEIYNVKTQNYGDITLDAYDNITYNLDENSYQTLNDNTIIYEMSLMTTVENKISTKQQEKTTNVILGDQNTQMKMIKTTVDLANAKITTTAREINDINIKFNDYVTTGTYSTLESRVNTIQTSTYTKTEVGQILKGEYTDGDGNKVQVTKAVTESGTFSNEGLRIQKEDENGNVISKTSGLFNELGVDIKRTSDNQNVLYAGMVDESDTRFSGYEGQTIVGTENVIVKTYLVMGDKSRFEDYEYATGKHATGCYWIGD